MFVDPQNLENLLPEYVDYKTHAAEISAKRASLESQRERVARRRQKLVDLYLNEAVTKEFLESEIGEIKNQLTLVDTELRKLEERVITQEELILRKQSLEVLHDRLRHKLSTASDEAKYEILHELAKEITVKGEDLTIEIAMPRVSGIEGQPTHGLSRKETFPVFLEAQLLTKSEIWRQAGIHRNFGLRKAA